MRAGLGMGKTEFVPGEAHEKLYSLIMPPLYPNQLSIGFIVWQEIRTLMSISWSLLVCCFSITPSSSSPAPQFSWSCRLLSTGHSLHISHEHIKQLMRFRHHESRLGDGEKLNLYQEGPMRSFIVSWSHNAPSLP